MGAKRLKKFLVLFPDAIDFIVRGLRSGLPVTESMNIVGKEMEEPVGSIFAHIGESVKLGVPVDKALQDTAKKLGLTEFNFFVTSIILQRETGGNLSEILNNLSEVLRTRLMMRMKIKAMSSEAKASAIIVGSLPFIVIAALMYLSPDYLIPLIDTTKGNCIALGCAFSLMFGIGVMIKMTKFEI
jgi:tight adherence protein B